MGIYEVKQIDERGPLMPMVIYILYLVGLFMPITALIGLVIAYVNRGDGEDWLQSHYYKQR